MSDLVISGIDLPPAAIRGATQSLEPIGGSTQLRRTINGTLADVSSAQFQKYQLTISCEDQAPPAFDGLWPGQEVTVDCIAELVFKTSGGTAARPIVGYVAPEGEDPGSPGEVRTYGDYTFYRPQLTMRVVKFSQETDEYGASVSWSLDLEEI